MITVAELTELIRCSRCGRKGYRAEGRTICVACAAREGGPKIHICDDEPLEVSMAPRASLVREVHLRAMREEWSAAKESELMEAIP